MNSKIALSCLAIATLITQKEAAAAPADKDAVTEPTRQESAVGSHSHLISLNGELNRLFWKHEDLSNPNFQFVFGVPLVLRKTWSSSFDLGIGEIGTMDTAPTATFVLLGMTVSRVWSRLSIDLSAHFHHGQALRGDNGEQLNPRSRLTLGLHYNFWNSFWIGAAGGAWSFDSFVDDKKSKSFAGTGGLSFIFRPSR